MKKKPIIRYIRYIICYNPSKNTTANVTKPASAYSGVHGF